MPIYHVTALLIFLLPFTVKLFFAKYSIPKMPPTTLSKFNFVFPVKYRLGRKSRIGPISNSAGYALLTLVG